MTTLQERIFAIFKAVSAICERRQIPYYAIGGTCIGAIRHKGFIPWDDDLDIAVPVEEFERLKEALKEELPPYFQVYTWDENPHYDYPFFKVHDIRTTFIERTRSAYPESYRGVYMDIMPLSGVPDGFFTNRLFRCKLACCYVMNRVRRFPVCSHESLKGNVASVLLKLWLAPFPYTCFSDKYLNELKRHPLSKSKLAGDVWAPLELKRKTFPASWFSESILMPFEDTTISVPVGYHEYLTLIFGDYMQPPPEAERFGTHVPYAVDLNQSYKVYQEQGAPSKRDARRRGSL